jgi:hypothetical protein
MLGLSVQLPSVARKIFFLKKWVGWSGGTVYRLGVWAAVRFTGDAVERFNGELKVRFWRVGRGFGVSVLRGCGFCMDSNIFRDKDFSSDAISGVTSTRCRSGFVGSALSCVRALVLSRQVRRLRLVVVAFFRVL